MSWSFLTRRPRRAALLTGATWILILVAPFIFILLVDYQMEHGVHAESAWQVHRARALKSSVVDARQLPIEGWEDVELPNRPGGEGPNPRSMWYRLEVQVPQDSGALWAVYIPRPNGNYTLSVNGAFVAETGSSEPPIPRYIVPIILKFPATMLHRGTNTLEIHVERERLWPDLKATFVGPDAVLGPVYDSAHFWTVTFKQVTVVCMFAMSLTMFALFAFRRQDAAMGWYALGLLFWAMHISAKLVPRAPFPSSVLWMNIPAIAIGAYLICAACFVNRVAGIKKSRVERGFIGWGIFGALVLILDPVVLDYRMPWFYERVWFPPILLWVTYQMWPLVRTARDPSQVEARLFAIVAWWALVVGRRDAYMGIGVLTVGTQYLTYVVGPVLLVFGLVLLRRFVQTTDAAERVRDELEMRVAEKTAALERNLADLKDLEREQALSAERELIMRDMHDGVGSQLVQALSIAVNRPELRPMEGPLRVCLEEMSLIIDSIEPVNGDLASVLGMLRMRMAHRFDDAGVHVRWEIVEVPVLSEFGPKRVLEVTRIVQEAIANALQHSRATQITVRTKVGRGDSRGDDPATVVIEVLDNGVGFEVPSRNSGGLKKMRRYAMELDGKLIIDSSAAGTTVRLELPLLVGNADELSAATND